MIIGGEFGFNFIVFGIGLQCYFIGFMVCGYNDQCIFVFLCKMKDFINCMIKVEGFLNSEFIFIGVVGLIDLIIFYYEKKIFFLIMNIKKFSIKLISVGKIVMVLING